MSSEEESSVKVTELQEQSLSIEDAKIQQIKSSNEMSSSSPPMTETNPMLGLAEFLNEQPQQEEHLKQPSLSLSKPGTPTKASKKIPMQNSTTIIASEVAHSDEDLVITLNEKSREQSHSKIASSEITTIETKPKSNPISRQSSALLEKGKSVKGTKSNPISRQSSIVVSELKDNQQVEKKNDAIQEKIISSDTVENDEAVNKIHQENRSPDDKERLHKHQTSSGDSGSKNSSNRESITQLDNKEERKEPSISTPKVRSPSMSPRTSIQLRPIQDQPDEISQKIQVNRGMSNTGENKNSEQGLHKMNQVEEVQKDQENTFKSNTLIQEKVSGDNDKSITKSQDSAHQGNDEVNEESISRQNSRPLKGILKKTNYVPVPIPPLSTQSSRDRFSHVSADDASILSTATKESEDLIIYPPPQTHNDKVTRKSVMKEDHDEEGENDIHDADEEDDGSLIFLNNASPKDSEDYMLPSTSKKIQIMNQAQNIKSSAHQNYEPEVDEDGYIILPAAAENDQDFDSFYNSRQQNNYFARTSPSSSRPNTRLGQKDSDPLDVGGGWNPSVKIERYDEYKIDSVFRQSDLEHQSYLGISSHSRTSTGSGKPRSGKLRVFSRLPRLSEPKFRVSKVRPWSEMNSISPIPFRAPGIAKPPSRKTPYREKFSTREQASPVVNGKTEKQFGSSRSQTNTPSNITTRPLTRNGEIQGQKTSYHPSASQRETYSTASAGSPIKKRLSQIPVLVKKKFNVASKYLNTAKKSQFPVVKIIPRPPIVKEEQPAPPTPKPESHFSRPLILKSNKKAKGATRNLPPIDTYTVSQPDLSHQQQQQQRKKSAPQRSTEKPYQTLTESPIVTQRTKITTIGGSFKSHANPKSLDSLYGKYSPILPVGYPSSSSPPYAHPTHTIPYSSSRSTDKISSMYSIPQYAPVPYYPPIPSTTTNASRHGGSPLPPPAYMPFYSPMMMFAPPIISPPQASHHDFIPKKFSKVPPIPTSHYHGTSPVQDPANGTSPYPTMMGTPFPMLPNPYMYGWPGTALSPSVSPSHLIHPNTSQPSSSNTSTHIQQCHTNEELIANAYEPS